METERSIIRWEYREPKGALDRFAGPGASTAELLLQFIGSGLAAVVVVGASLAGGWGWTVAQMIVAAVLALDVMGGVITNATGAAKRWYHREGQNARAHLLFVLIHAAQPTLLVLFFDPGNWTFVLAGFGYLAGSAVVLLLAPQYLQRPVSGLLVAVGIALALYAIPVPKHFEWFLPLYYMKMLNSHLLREEPYRPAAEEARA